MRDPSGEPDSARVYLTRGARESLAKLDPSRREALSDGFGRVGWQLLSSAERAAVTPDWSRRTWPLRHYPQQCYPKTVKYMLDHAHIPDLRLIHGIVSHAPHFIPLEHAWIELPGDIVFDGVVQQFFTRGSYYSVMAALALDTYSLADMQRLLDTHRGLGPWNAHWVPTAAQLEAYAAVIPTLQDAWTGSAPSNVGKKR